jgi:hypothetical protein
LLDTVQRRWKLYIAIVKRFKARVLRDTGTDDEETPLLLFELKDLYNSWESFNAKQLSKKNGVAAKKQKDLDACDNLRQTGIGNLAAMNDSKAVGTIDLAANEDDDTNHQHGKRGKRT